MVKQPVVSQKTDTAGCFSIPHFFKRGLLVPAGRIFRDRFDKQTAPSYN